MKRYAHNYTAISVHPQTDFKENKSVMKRSTYTPFTYMYINKRNYAPVKVSKTKEFSFLFRCIAGFGKHFQIRL